MAPPDTLTIRNLCPYTLTITQLERFPLPPALPQRPTLDNITDFSNLAHNFTGLLNKTPLRNTPIPSLLPSPGPDRAQLAGDAKSFHTEPASVKIGPFATLKGVTSLVKDGKNEILRLTFSNDSAGARGGGKWSVDVNPQSKLTSRKLTTLTPPPVTGTNTGEDYTSAVWHIAHSQLTLIWTPPLNKWMSILPNSLPVSALSAPGTHNSPTYHVAAPSVRCQAHPPAVQLANGIRFFDVRAQPEQKGTNMWLVHGAFPISLTGGKQLLTTLLNTTYEFLAANPTETVLISLKREGPFDVPDETFSQVLHDKIIAPNAEKWYTAPDIPTLQQCRGKCVLIRRFKLHPGAGAGAGGQWGIDASSWKYNTPNHTSSGGHIQVQDFCEVLAAENVEQKIGFVTAHIARAGSQVFTPPASSSSSSPEVYGVKDYPPPQAQPIHLNFLSASNFWNVKCWPEKIAERVNPAVLEYLCVQHATPVPTVGPGGDCGAGVLVGDYVGDGGDWDGVRACVALNGVVGGRRLKGDAVRMGKMVRAVMEKAEREKMEMEKEKAAAAGQAAGKK